MCKAALDGGSCGDRESGDMVAAGAHLYRTTSVFLTSLKQC